MSDKSTPDDGAEMERRQLTVMFVDLVGSTKLADDLDPEDLMAHTMVYQTAVEAEVDAYEGRIARVVGDGILVLFGWPRAHENDPLRAVHAAGAIHQHLARLSKGRNLPLEAHIGIATGVVLVGNVTSHTTAQSDVVFGAAPNLAARLQDLAGPGETIMAEASFQRLGGRFESEILGPLSLDGFEEEVLAYRLLSANPSFPAENDGVARPRTQFVGRTAELEQVKAEWAAAETGAGRAVVVIGEAGIGKSRFLSELSEAKELEARIKIVFECNPFHESTPFHPFCDLLERWSEIAPEDTKDTRFDKLQVRLSDILSQQDISLISALIAPEGRGAPVAGLGLSEAQFRARIHDMLMTILMARMMEAPLFIAVEDVHWIDPSSMELLQALVKNVGTLRALLVITSRTDASALLENKAQILALRLSALPEHLSADLARSVKGAASLPDYVLSDIIAATSGVPLFIEEYTSSVFSRLEGKKSGAQEPRLIPPSLYDLLTEQLDREDGLRPVLLAASVIGQKFDAQMLCALTGLPALEVVEALERLRSAKLLRSVSVEGVGFDFRHALLREAAYRSLVKARREDLHREYARYLQEQLPQFSEREPEVLAYHQKEGARFEEAAKSFAMAAGIHLNRYAHQEAEQNARLGLELLPALLKGAGTDRIELKLRFLSALAKRARLGYGAPEALEELRRATALAEELGDTSSFMRAGKGLFAAYQVQADFDAAEQFGRKILHMLKDNRAQMVGNYMVALAVMWRAELCAAKAALVDANLAVRAHVKEAQNQRLDMGALNQVGALSGLVEGFLGNGDVAYAMSREVVDQARETGQPLTMANAVHVSCMIKQMYHDPEALADCEALEDIATSNDMAFYIASAQCHKGGALFQNGALDEGYALLTDGWKYLLKTGCVASSGFVLSEQARCCLLMERYQEGFAVIEDALGYADRYGEQIFVSELHRIRGALHRALGQNDPAVSSFRTARAVAQAQGAALFELRALADLASMGDAPMHLDGWQALLAAQLEKAPKTTQLSVDVSVFS